MLIEAALFVLASAIATEPKKLPIEEVHASPYSFEGNYLLLCGEVADNGAVLYSDTIYPIHGRAGVNLRGYRGKGRDQCVTGRLLRTDGQAPGTVKNIIIKDAPVHPDYALVAEPR